MGCCGQTRSRMTGALSAATQRPQPGARVALYEYTGTTGMTVAAPVSGSKYRFAAPGAKVQVDFRDIAAMAGVPNLRRLG